MEVPFSTIASAGNVAVKAADLWAKMEEMPEELKDAVLSAKEASRVFTVAQAANLLNRPQVVALKEHIGKLLDTIDEIREKWDKSSSFGRCWLTNKNEQSLQKLVDKVKDDTVKVQSYEKYRLFEKEAHEKANGSKSLLKEELKEVTSSVEQAMQSMAQSVTTISNEMAQSQLATSEVMKMHYQEMHQMRELAKKNSESLKLEIDAVSDEVGVVKCRLDKTDRKVDSLAEDLHTCMERVYALESSMEHA